MLRQEGRESGGEAADDGQEARLVAGSLGEQRRVALGRLGHRIEAELARDVVEPTGHRDASDRHDTDGSGTSQEEGSSARHGGRLADPWAVGWC
ncbi:hypothetical protein GCM10009710_10690 [Aeromicrobium alkaliterrae]|uniref:Uncharacterized protein n=2 Tax=Aeromicrobium alkaliterrae TaxID=302168 RepID=A0ABP4VQZ2_9ACTN